MSKQEQARGTPIKPKRRKVSRHRRSGATQFKGNRMWAYLAGNLKVPGRVTRIEGSVADSITVYWERK